MIGYEFSEINVINNRVSLWYDTICCMIVLLLTIFVQVLTIFCHIYSIPFSFCLIWPKNRRLTVPVSSSFPIKNTKQANIAVRALLRAMPKVCFNLSSIRKMFNGRMSYSFISDKNFYVLFIAKVTNICNVRNQKSF